MPYKDKEKLKAYLLKNRQKNIDSCRDYRVRLREEVLTHYANGIPKCSCCGETHIEFLAIDHIEGGGTKHRKTLRGMTFYLWLRQTNYPKGYRVLCHNCNQAYGFYKYCPHNEM